jgi:hypothetical protein
MPVNKKTIRRVQDIATISSRGENGVIPYKAYMRLSILEMERHRRGRERDKALALLAEIDVRFKEIDTERTQIFKSLGFSEPVDLSKLPKPSASTVQSKSSKSFRIRY